MAWVKVGYGVWGDDAQDLADEFVEGFIKAREEFRQDSLAWGEVVAYLVTSGRELQAFDAFEKNSDSESLNPVLVSRTGEFLWSFKRVYDVNVGRSPNWDELIHAVAVAAGQLGVSEIPDSLGQVGLVDAIELEEVCYICGELGQPEQMIVTNLKDRIFVHEFCLAPSQTETIDIELSFDEVIFLANWSSGVNLPINSLITHVLTQELCKHGGE